MIKLDPRTIAALVLLLTLNHQMVAQHCESTIIIELKNSKGGFFQNQTATLTSKADGKIYSGVSNARGQATLTVPCAETFELSVTNYSRKVEVESPEGGSAQFSFTYSPTNLQDQKKMEMTPAEQAVVDKFFQSMPDTTFLKTSVMPPPKVSPDYHALVTISLTNIKGAPLTDEPLRITGRKRNKSIKGKTDKYGRMLVYLPKGDVYDISFPYNKNFYNTDCPYTKGSTNIRLSFSYIGTKEMEKRIREEKERLVAEEARLKRAKEAFERRCKVLGLTLEECYRREREAYLRGEAELGDTVVTLVLNRNKWTDKLIVCDLTGSMNPYAAQLALWYRLSYANEKNLQFVFFNDGDDKSDGRKKIGSTGGIYYTESKGVDSLDHLMSRVQTAGSGGDVAENNMEALIKGVKLAKPFKELVMIADNNAPVKDIELLSSFTTPVHIILCGVNDGWVLADYLTIAWKTKGTLHTIEEDITTLAKMSEGKEIKINNYKYRIMGGNFVLIE